MSTETLPAELPVSKAGVLFSEHNPPAETTIWRWISHGLKAPGGVVVRLVPRRVGGRTYITREAAAAFLAALNPAPPPTQAVVSESAKARARAAMAALDKMGV